MALLLPWEAPGVPSPLGVGAVVCFRAPGPDADQTKSMADASIYRVLLSLVVNLELMDDVEEKKVEKQQGEEGQESNGIPKWNELLGWPSPHWGDSSHLPRPSRRL